MLQIKRILLIAPTEMTRTPAFNRAQELACATRALLHIVAFDYVQTLAVAGLFDYNAMAQAREGYLQVHRQWLEQQARFQRSAGAQVTTEVVWARSSLAHVLAYVNNFRADLVIKDTLHVRAIDRVFHPPLDWQLLRDCSAAVHLVTNGNNPKPLKILAAIDLSHLEALSHGLNEHILELATTLTHACSADLHMVNVSNWSVVEHSTKSVPTQSLDDSLRDAVTDAQDEGFEVLGERYDIEKTHRHQLTGIPHRVIADYAKGNAFDMVVLGTGYQHGIERFIGSTAENLLNRSSCSLTIVKPASWLD